MSRRWEMMNREWVVQGLTAKPRSLRILVTYVAVEDGEDEPEARFHLVAPLFEHRGRTGDDDSVDAPSQEEFARDEACLDRLSESYVVGYEEVDTR